MSVEVVILSQAPSFLLWLTSVSHNVNSEHIEWMSQDELVNALKKQIAALEKTNKNQLQENADEINRLHRSLKESQQECRELLEAR